MSAGFAGLCAASRPAAGGAGAAGRAAVDDQTGRVCRACRGARKGRSAGARAGLSRPSPVQGRRRRSKRTRWSSRSSGSRSKPRSTSARRSSPPPQATLANADQQLQRTAELARKGNAPVAQLDQRTAEQGQAKAAVMEAEANLRDAQIQLSYTEIKTPISGRIGRAGGFARAIWSGRIPACWRPSSKTTRCRCSSP